MATTVNWSTKVILINRTDLQLVQLSPIEVRQLDLDAFRSELRALEASADGMAESYTHNHVAPVSVGGVTLARVVEIINGYTITFEDGQYAVNIVGGNSNLADIVNINNVGIRTANSAGLTFSEEINNQSFTNNQVYIHTTEGLSGTQFPRGTPTKPVDNFDDAFSIATSRFLRGFSLYGQMAIPQNASVDGTNWIGDTPINSIMIFSGQNTYGATFTRLGIAGAINGRASFDTCAFSMLSNFKGIAQNCGFQDKVTLSQDNTENVYFRQCSSVVPPPNKAELDINDSASPVHFRGYDGGILITNCTNPLANIVIDMTAGEVSVDASCTAGTITIRGNYDCVDNSNGATVVKKGSELYAKESTSQDLKARQIAIKNDTAQI